MATHQKKKRGPKPKDPSELMSQLTIRLSPKLKYGLELLARAQHRSLSQAVEWALQVGLNSFEVGHELEPIGALVDEAWSKESESERLLTLYLGAPELLEFEQRAACEMVERCLEAKRFEPPYHMDLQNPTDDQISQWQAAVEQGKRNEKIFYEFVGKTWPAIKEIAAKRANAGQETADLLLLGELGMLMPGVHDEFAFMAELLPRIPDPFEKKAWDELVADVMRQYEERVASFRKNSKPQ